MSEIKNGDEVFIYFNSHNTAIKATVLNIPRGNGDLLQIKCEDGDIMALNPYNPDFSGMTKFVKGEPNGQGKGN